MKNRLADGTPSVIAGLRKSSSLDTLAAVQASSSCPLVMDEESKGGAGDSHEVKHAPKSTQDFDNNELLEGQAEILIDQLYNSTDKAGSSPVLVNNSSDGRMDDLPKITTDSVKQRLRKIRIGVCCMQKKLQSRPMREILKFLDRNEEIEILRFNDDMIKNAPIEEWHRCDVLIAFYSTGFPLAKAISYVKKYEPMMINDLENQHELWDRVCVLEKLRKIDVPVAKSIVVYRGPRTPFTQEEIEA